MKALAALILVLIGSAGVWVARRLCYLLILWGVFEGIRMASRLHNPAGRIIIAAFVFGLGVVLRRGVR